ncbi:hypothetical protein K1719_008957 [Acacia pycnantha]|nr:hypothetical protein K1719_008957 [Acacia pycnantha]
MQQGSFTYELSPPSSLVLEALSASHIRLALSLVLDSSDSTVLNWILVLSVCPSNLCLLHLIHFVTI